MEDNGSDVSASTSKENIKDKEKDKEREKLKDKGKEKEKEKERDRPRTHWRPFDEPEVEPPCASPWLFGGDEDLKDKEVRAEYFKQRVALKKAEERERESQKSKGPAAATVASPSAPSSAGRRCTGMKSSISGCAMRTLNSSHLVS
ncbi:hypothetical protein ESCO_002752 [Escovopsis weberi]|uniref:Uncharacterized protein n=1 Tax=Escovopsis weberi TaxID=150374 RepID=A0A0N0RT11_ESCWE|nr:hypothetical protein ESCO_002752 [Escovopsis weberi]